MATYYLDYQGGNDANAGTSFALRWKTFTSGATAARIAPGDTIRVMGSPDPTSLGINGTWTDSPSAGTAKTYAISSSTNASPIAVTTSVSHGLETNDYVYITGHTTNTAANGLWKVTVTSGTAFTLNGSTGNGVGGATGTVQKYTNVVVQLASAVTKTVASTGNLGEGRTAWTASANVTTSLGSSLQRSGDVSDSISVAAAFTTGLAAFKALGSAQDFSGYKQISFNILQSSGTLASVAGDISIKLCSDTAGVTAVNTISVPALTATNVAHRFTVDTGAALGASIQSVALYVNTDRGAQVFNIDNIIACKDSTSADSLTLTTLIGKNTGNETWYPINAIKDTVVILGNGSVSGLGLCLGYTGTTETVTTYKRDTIPIQTAGITVVQDSGTAGNLISFEGGWDRTAMTTQSGETWLMGSSMGGNTMFGVNFNAKNFISINKINVTGFDRGLSFTPGSNIIVDNLHANGNTIGIYTASTAYGLYFRTIYALNNNSQGGINCANTNNMKFDTVYAINNSGQSTIPAVSFGTACDSIVFYNMGDIKNNYTAVRPGQNFRMYNATMAKSSVANVVMSSGTTNGVSYFRNTQMGGPVAEFGTGTGNLGLYVYSEKHDKTADNNYIFTDIGVIISDTSVRHTASGISWKMSPTSLEASSVYPLRLSIAKIACTANNLVTVKARMQRSNTGLTMSLHCPGGQLAGVASDVTSSMTAAANTWEELTITFTPTEAGVIEIFALAYGGTTFNGYVDDMTITQA